jgi:hypothetical protein
MLHVFMSNCLKGVRAYCDLCANSIIFEIAWLLLQIHYERGGGFGRRRRGKGVSFFRKAFFFIIEWLVKGAMGFYQMHTLN